MWYVPARPSAIRQQQRIARSATSTSCRGCLGVRRRTRSLHAVPRLCHAWRGVAWRGVAWRAWRAGGRSARAMSAAAPPPPPRRTRRACCYVVHVGEACPCADSGRSVCDHRTPWAAQAYPYLSVMLWSAAPTSSGTADLVQPWNAAKCSAVPLPDGRRNRRPIRHRRQRRRTGRGKAHPWLFLVVTSARASTSFWTIAGWS